MDQNLSDEKYEELVQLIYAVIDQPDGWYDFCKALTQVMDVTLSQIIALDLKHQALSFSVIGGLKDAAERTTAELSYLHHPVEEDPRWPVVLNPETVGWAQCHTFVTDEFVAQSRLYQEILLPFDSRYVSACKLLHDENVVVLLAIFTSQARKPLTPVELSFLNRLIPHLKRIVTLQKHIYQFSTGALVGYSLINKLHQPVILLTLAGSVAHSNAAAHQLMQLTDMVQIRDQQLIFPEPSLSAFQKKYHDLELSYRAGKLTSDAPENETCVKVIRPNGETLYVFSSLMIPENSMNMFGTRPLIMLTLFHPDFVSTVDMQLLSTIFGLTPAECRVALLLMEGLTLKEIAAKNDVKFNTVKKQMQAIYDKTATHRQSDLVKLLLNLPRQVTSPVASTNQSLSHP
ncbi:MAG: helix-turn-helix transcriptional regulator [Aquirhabdus sp.]